MSESSRVHNVRIRPEVYQALAREASFRDRTITRLVNNILEDYLHLDSSPDQRARRETHAAARRLS